VEWKSDAEKASGFQTIVDNLVLDNGYNQVVSGLIRGDRLLDIYLLWLKSSLFSSNMLPENWDHNGVLLEVEFDEICREPKFAGIVPLKTVILDLQAFLRNEFNLWAWNGGWVEETREHFKDKIFEAIKRYVPQTILSKNLDMNTIIRK